MLRIGSFARIMGEIVVLTGAAGCLGHHVLRLLISRDPKVVEIRCLDRVEPEELMRVKIDEELEKLSGAQKKSIEWIRGDVRDINVVERTVAGADCIIHCAAKIELWKYETTTDDDNELESINVGGTENLLKAAIRFGVPKFVHVSSFEIYMSLIPLYYATEIILPDFDRPLFGTSALTKRQAEEKVRQYSNNKLSKPSRGGKDSLNAVIIRFPQIYGEFEKYHIRRHLEVGKFFGGKIHRFSNIWIRQQPIYVANAAWSLIKAKQRMDVDESISGEEFHVCDETAIIDSYEFIEPYLETHGVRLTENTYPFFPILFLLVIFLQMKRLLAKLDIFGIFVTKRDRLQKAIERDQQREYGSSNQTKCDKSKQRWYDYITPKYLSAMCVSHFLNRTKASLRLDYDPIVEPKEAQEKTLVWCRDHLKV